MKTVLLLQRHQLIACQSGRHGQGGSVSFINSDSGVAEFRRYLRRYRHVTFVVLLDLGDEQFHALEIPRIRGNDQKTMLRHQQRKLFGDTPFASGIVGSKKSSASSTARLDVAHIGISADADNCVWLTELEHSGSHVRSFHWMSLLVYLFVNPTAESAKRVSTLTIVVIRIDTSDDRILAFRGRLPLICRRLNYAVQGTELQAPELLQSNGESEPDMSICALTEQLSQTLSYLANLADSGLQQMTVDTPISVVVAGNFAASEIEAVERLCCESGELPVTIVPVSQLVQTAGRKIPASGSVAELIMQSVQRRHAFSYSLVFRGAQYLQRTLRQIMYSTGISLLVGAAMASAASRHIENEVQSLVTLATDIEQQSVQLRHLNSHPEWAAQYTVDVVRESVDHVKAIEATSDYVTPLHFIVTLSEQLTRHPEIELFSVSWSGNEHRLTGGADTPVAKRLARNTNVVNAPPDASDFNAIVTGSVELQAQGHAPAMKRFRSFVESVRQSALTNAPGTRVTVINLPFTEGSSAIRNTGNGDFTLEVTSRRSAP